MVRALEDDAPSTQTDRFGIKTEALVPTVTV